MKELFDYIWHMPIDEFKWIIVPVVIFIVCWIDLSVEKYRANKKRHMFGNNPYSDK